LSYEGHNLDQLITVLERDSLTLIDWFTENQMKENPEKFEYLPILFKMFSCLEAFLQIFAI
jgi:hypothetical protein